MNVIDPGKSLRLLRKVRDVMAASAKPQERLNKIVRVIASGMKADVCSVNVMRAGNIHELFATRGLKRKAVHLTRLRVGEGIVGDIAAHAKPLALADATSHASYTFRPETGEEKFSSMLGVPILRSGNVIGVLVVQHANTRQYAEEETDIMQTVAMVLAELVSSGGLIEAGELSTVDGIGLLPLRLEGVQLNGGLAIGQAVRHQPYIFVRNPVAEDPEAELFRLNAALSNMYSALDALFSSSGLDAGESGDILETYRMFAEDRGFIHRIRDVVRTGLTAEAAVQKVQEDTRVRMLQIPDPYLRERLHDLEDLTNRLARHLSGDVKTAAEMDLPDNVVLIARTMGPADLLEYDPKRLRALVLEEGSQTSHVAIIARDMDIPVLGRVKDVLNRIDALEQIIVDADNEQIIIRPGDDALQVYKKNMRAQAQRLAGYEAIRARKAETRDGEKVSLNINAGLLADLPQMHATRADGIGLYRTEIPFMVRSTFPDVDAQTKLYKKVIDQAKGRSVIFRTLDIGGDKALPYMRLEEQDNPAMGWRSIRIGLDRPAILRQQLRALIRAAAGRKLDIAFPMISDVSEFLAARAVFDLELQRARSRKQKLPRKIRVGSMLEVPALAWQLPAIGPHVDFVSVGSNDLVQFLYASDRGNPHLSGRYDPLSPPVLSFLRWVVKTCDDLDLPISLCGEMGGRPLEAMALVGLGFRSLSMAPSAIGPVKYMVLTLEVEPLRDYLDILCGLSDHSVRDKLSIYARDHGITV